MSQICELARRLDVALSVEQAEQLQAAFGGLPAAVRLVLEEVDQAGGELPLSRAEDYLRDTVLPGIGDELTLRQVMRFSLAGRLMHRLIRDLADQQPEELIRLIESPGLVVRHYDGEDVVLVFPSFVCDTLREAFTAREPDEARAMHRRLSRWFVDHDGAQHLPLALHHAVAGEDWQQLDRIWTDHSSVLGLEHPRPLASALAAVPQPVLATRPGMLVGYAMAGAAASTRWCCMT